MRPKALGWCFSYLSCGLLGSRWVNQTFFFSFCGLRPAPVGLNLPVFSFTKNDGARRSRVDLNTCNAKGIYPSQEAARWGCAEALQARKPGVESFCCWFVSYWFGRDVFGRGGYNFKSSFVVRGVLAVVCPWLGELEPGFWAWLFLFDFRQAQENWSFALCSSVLNYEAILSTKSVCEWSIFLGHQWIFDSAWLGAPGLSGQSKGVWDLETTQLRGILD